MQHNTTHAHATQSALCRRFGTHTRDFLPSPTTLFFFLELSYYIRFFLRQLENLTSPPKVQEEKEEALLEVAISNS